MSSVNKVILVGWVGKDPEIRSTQAGKEIGNVSIATTESWKNKQTGERNQKTEWHRVVVYNEGLVKVLKSYVKKGDKLYIEGQLQTKKWQDQSGQDRYTTEVVLQAYNGSLVMLSGKKEQTEYTQDEYESVGNASPDNLDDEIPF